MDTGLPLVTYKAAVSLDGKVAAADGGARWISSAESRRLVHELRARADAVLVGAGTVRRDDPSLTVRDAEGRDPVRVVLARHGDVPLDATLVRTARETPTLVVAETIDDDREAALRERGVEVVVTGAAGPRAALAALAQRGLLDVLCEGGPTVAAALLREGLVERLLLFVAPLLVGSGAPELLALPAAATMDEVLRLDEVSWERVGDDMLVRARVPHRVERAQADGRQAARRGRRADVHRHRRRGGHRRRDARGRAERAPHGARCGRARRRLRRATRSSATGSA